MNNKAWSHLPNADHIDWVIESVKDNPGVWVAARDAALDAARDTTWDATWTAAAVDAAYGAAQNAAWNEAQNAACNEARDEDRVAAWNAAWFVLTALVAYDDCSEYLQMTYEQLYAWARLSETPQAVLLLPLKWAQEHEQQSLVTTA